MDISLKSIRALGWKATISDWTDNVKWLTFSEENISGFSSSCTVTLNSDRTTLTVTPTANTEDVSIVIGDILFDYINNTDENAERKAAVSLTQLENGQTHEYIFIQAKDQLVSTEYTNFKCNYKYHFENTPSTNELIDGVSGGTINIYSVITSLEITYQYIKRYQSSPELTTDITYFKYTENSNGRRLYSGTSETSLITVYNFDQYLEDVTRILKRSEYGVCFFGFSSDKYEEQFSYSYSATTDNTYNITTSNPNGDVFTVNVGKNISETTERQISISAFQYTYEDIVSASTDQYYSSNIFIYTQESGYTEDIRHFVLTFTKTASKFSIRDGGGSTLTSFVLSSGKKYYLYKENGETKITNSEISTPNSYWTSYTNEGSRPYPEFNDQDEVIKNKNTGRIYNKDYSGSVCVDLSAGWFDSSCSGRREDCQAVSYNDVTFDSGASETQKEGYCYCNDLKYIFSANTRELTFSGTGDEKEIEIDSYSACSSNWYYYRNDIPKDACVEQTESGDCPCFILDNRISGTTYDNSITYEFDYDYNQLKNKYINIVVSTPNYGDINGNIFIKNNLLGKKIELQAELKKPTAIFNLENYSAAGQNNRIKFDIKYSVNYSDGGILYNSEPYYYRPSFVYYGIYYDEGQLTNIIFDDKKVPANTTISSTTYNDNLARYYPASFSVDTIGDNDYTFSFGLLRNFVTLIFHTLKPYTSTSNNENSFDVSGKCEIYISDNGRILDGQYIMPGMEMKLKDIRLKYFPKNGQPTEISLGDDYEWTGYLKNFVGMNGKILTVSPNCYDLSFKTEPIRSSLFPSDYLDGTFTIVSAELTLASATSWYDRYVSGVK